MAQSAVKVPKKPLPRAERPVRMSADGELLPHTEGIPLYLTPLLSPYRARGRLGIRIENLPQRARLSHGRNNGDESWSLHSDELDGLLYFPPEGYDDTHSLSVRILSFEGGSHAGATIAVIDYTVSRREKIHEHGTAEVERDASRAASAFAPEPVQDAKLSRLENELERVRAILSAHETVLSSAEQRFGRAPQESSQVLVERELEKAKSAWDAEHDRRLAEIAAEAAANLERSRSNWQAELDARLAQSEEQARKELSESRERWREEMQAALSNAERAWRSDEVARIAAAEAEWRRQAEVDLAASKGASDEDAVQRDRLENELKELRGKLSEALSTLAERESSLAQAQFEWGRDRERALRERDVALKEAQKAWAADESKRFAQAEARWREESGIKLAELSMRCERAESSLARERAEGRGGRALADAENARDKAERTISELKLEIASLKQDLAERDEEIVNVRASSEQAREQTKLQNDVILERAQAAWRSESAARLAAAKATWRQETAQSLAALRNENEALREQLTSELKALEDELAAARAQINERNADLTRAHTDSRALQERLQQELNTQLMAAQRAWKADEAARVSAAKAEWQQGASRALAEATARYQAAETALARQRAKSEEDLRRGTQEVQDNEHLRHEILLLQAALDKCEKELAILRAAPISPDVYTPIPLRPLDSFQPRQQQSAPANADDSEEEERGFRLPGLVRDAAVIAALVAVGMISFPYIEAYLPDEWQYDIAQVTGQVAALAPTQQQAAAPAVAKPARRPLPPPPLPTGEVTHAVNLRSDASTSGDVRETLSRGTFVTVLENRGDWVRVRAVSSDGKADEGWIASTHLKLDAAAAVLGQPSP